METVQELSKSELFKKNLMEGFFIFEKGEFPALTGTEYDPIIFSIVNSAYAENSARFFDILEPHLAFDAIKKKVSMKRGTASKLNEEIIKDQPLNGKKVFEIEAKETGHLDYLRTLGAEVDSNSVKKLSDFEGRLTLKNYSDFFRNGKFDIILSNGIFNNNNYIKYGNFGANYCGLELYTIFSNISKKGGYTFHANGNMISSLFITFFQFIGQQTIEYFRHSSGEEKFMMIMSKINNKVTSYEEFLSIYTELKKRNPIRYG